MANRLQLVISDLIGRSSATIQDNLHLVRQILEGIKDDTEAALINLDQSKAFDRVDHRFLATVLETAECEPEFHKWISMLYHNPQAVVQGEWKAFEGLCDRAVGSARLSLVSSSLCPRFEAPAPEA